VTTPLMSLLSRYAAELEAEQVKLYDAAKSNKPYGVIASLMGAQQQLVAELIPKLKRVRLSTPQEHSARGALLEYLTALSKGLAALEAGYLAQPKTRKHSSRAAIGHFAAAIHDLQVAKRAYQTAKRALRL
jgi:hypothetical protein